MKDTAKLRETIEREAGEIGFSGVVHISHDNTTVTSQAFGEANRADNIRNTPSTRFAIASGSKIFTAVAVCQLAARGKLSFDSRLTDCLDIEFPHFDPDITIHHLLTHSSGMPDYWDEDSQEYEDLWKQRPMYNMTSPKNFLPMFQDSRMLFSRGERFRYTDAGFIVLGLLVEQHSGCRFQDYIQENIFEPSAMTLSGYFEADRLPDTTALGYIENNDTGEWKTNLFAVPIIGGPDGGAYVTAEDMSKFWRALSGGTLLPGDMVESMTTPHIQAKEEGEGVWYGYGVWLNVRNDAVRSYNVGGWDPGVNMWSEFTPDEKICLTIIGNTNRPIMPIKKAALAVIHASHGL